MIKIKKFKGQKGLNKLEQFLEKRRSSQMNIIPIVSKILKDIKKNKKKALLKYEKKFSNNSVIKPNKTEINKASKSLSPKIKKAIDFAYNRIFKYHSLQKLSNIFYKDKLNNSFKYKSVPLNKIGIYVPANLPSTLMMNAIPAMIAGVKNIVLANPRLSGRINPAVMYVAKKCKIKKIISVGGAQAIGSLAYIQKVDKIFGPGNDFVARAKREVFGDVGIEGMIAGPSEITVVADKLLDMSKVITSMIAQSEHGINSQSILITKNEKLIKIINKKINIYIKKMPRKNIVIQSLKKNGLLILAKINQQIVNIINIISPEHLELLSKDYKKLLSNIYNVGSIGLGIYSPVAASDYNVGTNHTLGTLGSARFASGLNLNDFYKKISRFTLSKKGIEVIGKQAITLAEYENLYAHALSIKSRL